MFDGIGNEYARHMDIHVAGQRITAVVARGRLPLPERVYDAQDKVVLPGFIDVHAHHSQAVGERLGRMWLAHGVTTVREIGPDSAAAWERAESWSSGRRLGPRLVLGGNSRTERRSEPRSPALVGALTGITNGFAHALAAMDIPTVNPSIDFPSVIAAERNLGPPLLVFSPLNRSYQDSIGSLRASEAFAATGLSAIDGGLYLQHPELRAHAQKLARLYTRDELSRWGERERDPELLGALTDTLARVLRSSGKLAIGSDAPAVPYGYGLHLELRLLAEAGIPNAQLLRLATASGALALGVDGQLGTLEAGKLADLLIVDGDPLARISDALRIDTVIKGGVALTEAQLLSGSTN